ncbi:hypothetical protein [uncultured Anaeromusa sp.]|uniref:hypothetical protein n=1 Tax=uncultured Anaeromusa sp. TaxID=673273 RepID=UPI0029C854B6|nr:hypothetical protein [uncultured Anaeromusa sp.]
MKFNRTIGLLVLVLIPIVISAVQNGFDALGVAAILVVAMALAVEVLKQIKQSEGDRGNERKPKRRR